MKRGSRTLRPWRLLCALALLLAAGACAAIEPRASEAQVKAAFLFKFAGYVEWPAAAFAAPGAPFAIGVLDAAPLARELEAIVAQRRIQGRPVRVRELAPGERGADLQILFVGRDAETPLQRVLAGLRGRTTLVVTESDGALAAGSTINFVLVDGKVRFDIAPPQDPGGLRISSRLLAVARSVRDPAP